MVSIINSCPAHPTGSAAGFPHKWCPPGPACSSKRNTAISGQAKTPDMGQQGTLTTQGSRTDPWLQKVAGCHT